MTLTARLLTPLAVIFLGGACLQTAPSTPTTDRNHERAQAASSPILTLQPSPNRLVGRVLAIDATRGFTFIDLTAEPPPASLTAGAELITRTADLRETAQLRASRYVRGRTLAAKIISGQPSPGDEVVFHLP